MVSSCNMFKFSTVHQQHNTSGCEYSITENHVTPSIEWAKYNDYKKFKKSELKFDTD